TVRPVVGIDSGQGHFDLRIVRDHTADADPGADATGGHGSRAGRTGPADHRLLGDGDLGADLVRRGDIDRDAVEHGRARQRIEPIAVVELVDVDAGLLCRDALPRAAAVV